MIKCSPTLSILIATATTFCMTNAMATQCPKAINPNEMGACYYKGMTDAQKKLNIAYKRYIATLDEQKDKDLTQKAQNAWVKFRDMDCSVIVPENERYGVGYYQWASCMKTRATHRAQELNELTSCRDNGCRPVRAIPQ
jgi:uncharacterized protein YecT (DUF1311 family)